MANYVESWRRVWRNGFAPGINNKALLALREALSIDDFRVIQGSTTTPPPLMSIQDWHIESACAIGFCGWKGNDLETVDQVEEYFATSYYNANQRIGDNTACRQYLEWYDEIPREEMITELLKEVEIEIERREAPGYAIPRNQYV